jgi:hypothetical protein
VALPFAGFALVVTFFTAGFGFGFFLGSSSSNSLGGDDSWSSESKSSCDFLDRFLARPPSSGEVRFGGLNGFEGLTGFERRGTLAGLVSGAEIGEPGAPAARFS